MKLLKKYPGLVVPVLALVVGVLALCLAAACAAPAGEPLGLVLSGGGAKGAYEVGAWQALEEAGFAADVVAISGTSVGALNAALFATRPEAAEALWLEHMEAVFTPNTNRIGQSIQKTLDDISGAVDVAEETGQDWKGLVSFLLATGVRIAADAVEVNQTDAPRDGYIDSTRLAAAIDSSLPRDWPDGTPTVYATALEKGTGGTAATWCLNGEPHERRSLMIRASAAIPMGFDTVSLDGKTYEDGGREEKGGNNVPLAPILANHPGIKTVVVIYLSDEKHLDRKRFGANRAAAEAAGVRLVEIVPSEDIGRLFGWLGTFDARPETARHLIALGRADAGKALARRNLSSESGEKEEHPAPRDVAAPFPPTGGTSPYLDPMKPDLNKPNQGE